MHRAAAAAAAASDCLQIQFRPDAYTCIVFSCLHVFWFGFHCFLLFIWTMIYLTIWLADSSFIFRHANNFYAINHFIYENTIIATSLSINFMCIYLHFIRSKLFVLREHFYYKNAFIVQMISLSAICTESQSIFLHYIHESFHKSKLMCKSLWFNISILISR